MESLGSGGVAFDENFHFSGGHWAIHFLDHPEQIVAQSIGPGAPVTAYTAVGTHVLFLPLFPQLCHRDENTHPIGTVKIKFLRSFVLCAWYHHSTGDNFSASDFCRNLSASSRLSCLLEYYKFAFMPTVIFHFACYLHIFFDWYCQRFVYLIHFLVLLIFSLIFIFKFLVPTCIFSIPFFISLDLLYCQSPELNIELI